MVILGGRDVTQLFVDIGHTLKAGRILSEYYLGEVVKDI